MSYLIGLTLWAWMLRMLTGGDDASGPWPLL